MNELLCGKRFGMQVVECGKLIVKLIYATNSKNM